MQRVYSCEQRTALSKRESVWWLAGDKQHCSAAGQKTATSNNKGLLPSAVGREYQAVLRAGAHHLSCLPLGYGCMRRSCWPHLRVPAVLVSTCRLCTRPCLHCACTPATPHISQQQLRLLHANNAPLIPAPAAPSFSATAPPATAAAWHDMT